jgi:hypothetical protein
MFPHPAVPAGGRVFGMDLSDDGSLLAVACMPRDGSPAVKVWRTEAAALVASFGVGSSVGRGVSAGGKVVHSPGVVFAGGELWFGLSAGADGPALWRAAPDDPPVLVGRYTPAQLESLLRSPDGRLLGIAGTSLEIRDLAANAEIVRYIGNAGTENEPLRACFSAHAASVWLYGRDPGAIVLHDLTTGEDVRRYEAPAAFGRHVAASPSGRWVLVSARRGTFLYDTVEDRRHTAVGSVVVDFSTSWPGHLGVFTADDRTLVLPTSRLMAVDLGSPDLAVALGPKSPARGAAVAVAAARSAGVVAWATDDDQVVWARMETPGSPR